MNPDNQQFGSFGNLSPDGMAAIKEALARRGQGTPVPALDTQSAVSPTASPLPAVPQGDALPTTTALPEPTVLPEALPQTPQGNPEAKMIIGALRERLKAISTIEVGGYNV